MEEKPDNNANINRVGVLASFSGRYGVILLVGFTLLLRLMLLDAKPLYVDEAVTVYISQRPVSQIVSLMMKLREVHPPLYFWFIGIWLQMWKVLGPMFKNYLAWIRLSSVIFGTLSVYFTYLLTQKLFDRKTALLTGFLMAASSFHICFSQELRMYPLLLFLMTASFYYFIQLLEKPEIKAAAGFVLTTGIAFLVHYYAFYILAVDLIFLARLGFSLWRKKPAEGRRASNEDGSEPGVVERITKDFYMEPSGIKYRIKWILGVFAASALFFLPWVSSFIKQTGFQPFEMRINPTIGDFFQIFSRLAYSFTLIHPHIANIDIFTLASVLPLFLIVYGLIKHRGGGKVFALIFLLTPLVITLLVSLLSRFHIFEYKYFYIITPPFWMLVSLGLLSIDKGRWKWVLVGMILLANIYTGYNALFNRYYYPQDWSSAAAAMRGLKKSGQVVAVHPSMMSLPFQFYYGAVSDFYPIDTPQDPQLEFIEKYDGLWVITTPHHPFVGRAGLMKYLTKKYPGQTVAEIPNYRPSGVIRIDYFLLEKEKNGEKTK